MIRRGLSLATLAVLCLCCSACGLFGKRAPDSPRTAYHAENVDSVFAKYAPIFVIRNRTPAFNRIGSPIALTKGKKTKVRIDPDKPVLYVAKREFATKRGKYTNLIYRIHFKKVPAIHLTQGKNIGLFCFVTLDAKQRPVLITTVHTCGCYLAMAPTSYLPEDAYPKNWKLSRQKVYGEKLPGLLRLPPKFQNRFRPLIYIGNAEHRVTDMRVADIEEIGWRYRTEEADIEPVEKLRNLQVDGKTTSFFHETGSRKGYVKGASKPFEMLLMGWFAFDFRVGRDKRYAPSEEMVTRFYTSLKLWRRTESDLWHFNRCLEYFGWDL